MKLIKIQQQGQIALPKEFRDELGLKTGSYVVVNLEDGKIVVKEAKIET